jgi:hypothetical protein
MPLVNLHRLRPRGKGLFLFFRERLQAALLALLIPDARRGYPRHLAA